LILDFGAKCDGYCSDMTRTLYVGKPTEKDKEIYKYVLDVQKTAVKMSVVGVCCCEIYSYALDMLGNEFCHNLGHGVGLEIHEAPNLGPGSEHILKEGMCITIEPGIYNEGKYGIRIEDTVLITKNGPKILTRSRKELIRIKKK
jgi:Xaa-Pro aminopeptidase